MVNLLVKCPKCKAIVSTGMLMDFASFSSSTLVNNSMRQLWNDNKLEQG
jgi:phage FluMu protein Com